ncbi:hypothetical protein [Aquimarina sp. MMG016]|uniref:VOC family protein n=1 Tax=Aquimarina sp. MMG016 TaxID=2822690 RepID=UPI001B3A6B37|nr:hypothetical protein [Aquimarina sp. MMG016]MBQ4822006.1 hypothetical protein [Aquimarina sp. MMG016]
MKDSDISRRAFVKNTSLGMMLIALHPESCFAYDNHPKNIAAVNLSKFDLIKNIRLLTSTSLDKMKAFYVDKLGFSIESQEDAEITFIAGVSTITFIKINPNLGNPWYHFAFNIPENKLLRSRRWLLERTDIIPTPKRARDPKFPDDVRHFRNWNAHSIFFWDPAGNLLEFIARHDLKNGTEGEFTSNDILNVSEIAFVVDDQQGESEKLHDIFGLDVYPKNSNFWWAMGDEKGLLLCIPKRLWGENTDTPKRFKIFKTEATIVGLDNKTYSFSHFPYQVQMTKRNI